ncbi:uncharacterized protein J3R85_010422 [Psidium guajava]|nr:uncharacterized protein J3R85_010422 [Psidium guajava]
MDHDAKVKLGQEMEISKQREPNRRQMKARKKKSNLPLYKFEKPITGRDDGGGF